VRGGLVDDLEDGDRAERDAGDLAATRDEGDAFDVDDGAALAGRGSPCEPPTRAKWQQRDSARFFEHGASTKHDAHPRQGPPQPSAGAAAARRARLRGRLRRRGRGGRREPGPRKHGRRGCGRGRRGRRRPQWGGPCSDATHPIRPLLNSVRARGRHTMAPLAQRNRTL